MDTKILEPGLWSGAGWKYFHTNTDKIEECRQWCDSKIIELELELEISHKSVNVQCLELMCYNDSPDICKVLCIMIDERGADPNYNKKYNDSILNAAILHGTKKSVKMTRFLLCKGADPNQQNKEYPNGSRPVLHWCGMYAEHDSYQSALIIQLMINAGCKFRREGIRHSLENKVCCAHRIRNRSNYGKDTCFFNEMLDMATRIQSSAVLIIGIRKYMLSQVILQIPKDVILIIARMIYTSAHMGPIIAIENRKRSEH